MMGRMTTELARIRAVFDASPINAFLGMRMVQRSAQETVLLLDPRPELIQETGVIHGGILTTLADTAAVYTIAPDVPEGQTLTSVEFKMNFLRAGFGNKGPITTRASRLKLGKRIAVAEATLEQGEQLLAKGTFTYLIFETGQVKDPRTQF